MSTHYDTLAVAEDAQESDIKRAWARLVRLNTPDQDPEGNRRINEAKSTLLDPRARADYDAQLNFGAEIADLFDQGHSAMAEEEFGTAIEVFKEILAFHPGSLDARNQLALAYAHSEEFAQAVHQFEKLVASAQDSALYASNLAHTYLRWGSEDASKLSLAERWFKRAAHLESYNASHHLSLSRLYVSQDRFEDAEHAIEFAISADGKVDSDDIDSMIELTWVYLFSDQKEKIPGVADRVKAAIPDDDESRQYASFLFLRTAADLATNYRAYQHAAYFVTAAKRIMPSFGKAQVAIDEIERMAKIDDEADRMRDDQSVRPPVMSNMLAAIAHRRLGHEIPDDFISRLMEASATWSQADLRSAAEQCRQKYPYACASVDDIVDQVISVGSRRVPSGGCAVLVLTGLVISLFVLL